MVQVFEVVAEPNRRRILELLREGHRTAGDIVDSLAISQPGVSKHLKVLRQAGLVQVRGEAQRRIYSLRPEPLAEMDAWLEPFRAFWTERLDALGRHLDQEC